MLTRFTTPAHLHAMNLTGSSETHAKPVLIGGPSGSTPGVGMFRGKYLIGILTEQDATRLADQLIDSVEGL